MNSLPRHFYLLDALRGIAALGVVLWHWNHFFQNDFIAENQPFYSIFRPFYHAGFRAVDLFFCLSGFIFYWLYADTIKNGEISARDFSIRRFSRLYPLHALTLFVVLIGQYFLLVNAGAFFVYPNNDFFHFALQTVFASSWGLERGLSFNGPAWSVSVEVALYAIFFFACTLNFNRARQLAVFVLLGMLLRHFEATLPIGRGLIGFFMGGISFQIARALAQHGISNWMRRGFAVATLLAWLVVANDDVLYAFCRTTAGSYASIGQRDLCGALFLKLPTYAFELIVFPLTVITCALWEERLGTLAKRLSFLGEASYSSYLLHFPLQLLFFTIARYFDSTDAFFYSPLSLFAFFVVLIPLSIASYRYFERPCQAWVRDRTSNEVVLISA